MSDLDGKKRADAWITSLLCTLWVVGCGATTPAAPRVPQVIQLTSIHTNGQREMVDAERENPQGIQSMPMPSDKPSAKVPVAQQIPPERVIELCWMPPELDPTAQYFVFLREDDTAVSEKQEPRFSASIAQGGFIFKYSVDAPVKNLQMVPLSRVDAWCTRIPKPTDPAVLRLLDPCAVPTSP